MFTPRHLRILGVALCATTAGVTALPLPQQVVAAPTSPQVYVIGHVSTHPTDQGVNPARAHFARQMMLGITGSHFVPGSQVGIAVPDTAHWEVGARVSTNAQPAVIVWYCQTEVVSTHCPRPNPYAGTIAYRLRLDSPRAAADLQVLYRAPGDAGMQGVTLR